VNRLCLGWICILLSILCSPCFAQEKGAANFSPNTTCETLREHILERTTDAYGSLDIDDQEELVRWFSLSVQINGAVSNESCAITILREVANSDQCGSAAELISSSAVTDELLYDSFIEEILQSRANCVRSFVAGLQQIQNPSTRSIQALISWITPQKDLLVRAGGLVVLGSLGRHARELGQLHLATQVEQLIKSEISHRTGTPDIVAQRLESAGNLGCESCFPMIEKNIRSTSFPQKFSAIGALRFIETKKSVQNLCNTLIQDQSATIREHAAWSLGWRSSDKTIRVNCLTTAAAIDESTRVRLSATMALVSLAEKEEYAASALLHLTLPEYDKQVRKIASQHLDRLKNIRDGNLNCTRYHHSTSRINPPAGWVVLMSRRGAEGWYR
jgi:hypothetical protein